MESPLGELMQWLLSLPVNHREHIALVIALDNDWLDDIPGEEDAMLDYLINKASSKINQPAEVGFTLAIRAQIDFMFYYKEVTKERNAVVSAELKKELAERGVGHLTDAIQRSAAFVDAQWKSTHAKWGDLRGGYLSDEHISEWSYLETFG